MAKAEREGVDHATIRKVLSEVITALEPLSKEERRRVVGSVVIFYEVPIGKDPRAHGGDHDCG